MPEMTWVDVLVVICIVFLALVVFAGKRGWIVRVRRRGQDDDDA